MSRKNGISAPVFDLSGVGYGWQKKYMKVNVRIVRNDTLIRNVTDENASDDDKQRVQVARLEAMEEMPDITDRRDSLICEVLRDVPRDWLLASAPESLDWTNTESLDYLQTGKFDEVQRALNDLLNPKN